MNVESPSYIHIDVTKSSDDVVVVVNDANCNHQWVKSVILGLWTRGPLERGNGN